MGLEISLGIRFGVRLEIALGISPKVLDVLRDPLSICQKQIENNQNKHENRESNDK